MASVERVYEDFVPPHQMEREPATHTLTVNLTAQGYKKEHIRVQMVHSHRRLIVRGERPVDGDGSGNRWSRFRLELRVPDGCDAKAIHARFDNGVVRVTMPGAPPEPVAVVDSVTGGKQQQPQPPSPAPPTPKQRAASTAAAVAGGDVQDRGDRDRAAPRGQEQDDDKQRETPRKQEARQRVVTSAKDAGDDDTGGGVGEVMAAASPASARQGYGFLQNRKTTTTVLGVVLVLISLGIYVRYSLWP